LNGNAKLLEIINSAKVILNIPEVSWAQSDKNLQKSAPNKLKKCFKAALLMNFL
jgi:hypothetical protein